MNRIKFRFGVTVLMCLFLSTAVAYLQDPTVTPTPTCRPSPTPRPITPCPSFTCPPTWNPTSYTITSNDENAFDCGPGHDGYDHLYSITATTAGWCIIQVQVDDEDLDLDYGFQQLSSATPHETESNIGCWDYLGAVPTPTVTPTYNPVFPTPTPTPTSNSKDEDDYGMYWSTFRLSIYLEPGENYYFWVGGHDTSDLGDYKMRFYYEYNQPKTPTPTLTPEPTCTP